MAEVALNFPSPSHFFDTAAHEPDQSPPRNIKIKATLPEQNCISKKRHTKCTVTGSSAQPGSKPRQTKSRDGNILSKLSEFHAAEYRTGCQTCKVKRLKCDETKPTCRNCERRGVRCGGYQKVLQWRSHEKATFDITHAPLHRKKRKNCSRPCSTR